MSIIWPVISDEMHFAMLRATKSVSICTHFTASSVSSVHDASSSKPADIPRRVKCTADGLLESLQF